MEILFTPWRYSYITKGTSDPDCFFCTACPRPDAPDGRKMEEMAEDAEGLVVATGRHHLVMLNRHPYSNGHLMVAPFEHLASPQESSAEARDEFWPLVLRCQRVLSKAYAPHGFNLGMNVGTPAGAGVPGHFHFHLVPRWNGDTNFMTVLAGVRLVPEDLGQARERLRALFRQEEG